LSFDGVDDYVSVPDSVSLRAVPFTVEFWINLRSWATYKRIIAKGDGYYAAGGWHVETYQNYFRFYWNYDRSAFDSLVATGVTIEANKWYHVVAIHTGSTAYLYVNGIAHSKSTTLTPTGAPGYPVQIGGNTYANTYIDGLIDEVRIYNYARTPDEIRLDYNAGYAARFGPSTDCNSDPGSCMTKGLVAYWSFDEGSGNIAYDSSGNGNHGTIYGAKWTQGKFGQALSFDGVDDYVDTTAINITGPITITLWVKLNVPVIDKVHTFVNKYPAINYWMFAIHQFEKAPIIGFVFTNAGWQRTAGYATALTDMKWHFLAAGYDGTKLFLYEDGILKQTKTIGSDTIRTSAHTVKIGGSTVANEWLNGLIDEVRIYNRALSEEEIRYHYNHTLPKGALSPLAMKEDPSLVGYWSFNEGKGTIIYDQSGKNNNGTLYLGSSGNTDPSKAWSPGISGTALSFDGVDDYVITSKTIPITGNQARTLEFWVKVNSIPVHPYVIGWGNPSNNNEFAVVISAPTAGSGTWYLWGWGANDWNTGVAVQTSVWQHHAITYDGTVAKWYINGNSIGSFTHTYNTLSDYLTVGKPDESGQSYFNGLIDEVRIYNRALSEQEILEHYRNSKYYLASHFGPKTNCREDPGSCIDYGLVGYWSFDEGAGTTAYDASGKGNNGTISKWPKMDKWKIWSGIEF